MRVAVRGTVVPGEQTRAHATPPADLVLTGRLCLTGVQGSGSQRGASHVLPSVAERATSVYGHAA